MTTLTITHPAYLAEKVGAQSDMVIPVHVAQSANGHNLVRVYEPRRDCEYWVKRSDLFPPSKRTW